MLSGSAAENTGKAMGAKSNLSYVCCSRTSCFLEIKQVAVSRQILLDGEWAFTY